MSLPAASKEFGFKKGAIQHWAATGQVKAKKDYHPDRGRMVWIVSREDMRRITEERKTQEEVEW